MAEENKGYTPGDEEKKEQNTTAQPQSNSKRAFCVALPVSGGKPLKMVGDNPHEFTPLLKDSSVAWL
ncbi:MAG TPA: hypothetical protein VIO11_04105, partial [Candidatus Methanoperedens sp.]